MIAAQEHRFVLVTPPAAIVDNASLTTAEIDTVANGVKYDYVEILVLIGATDIALTALQVQESDVSGSGFADITGATFSTLPSATNDNTIWRVGINMLQGRKRYLDVVCTVGDGTAGAFVTVLAILSRPHELPNSLTEKGLGGDTLV